MSVSSETFEKLIVKLLMKAIQIPQFLKQPLSKTLKDFFSICEEFLVEFLEDFFSIEITPILPPKTLCFISFPYLIDNSLII